MSHKQAKMIRKLIGFHPADEREYNTSIVKTVAVDTGRIDANGNAIIDFQQRVTTVAKGLRNAYQRAKKHYKGL